MTSGIGAVSACMSLASPDERRWVSIPAFDGVAEPIFEYLHIIDMMPLHRSADENALYRFGHIQPGARTGRVHEANAEFMTPPHKIATVMARQIVQYEQHAQGRKHPIELLGGWKRVPILPAPSFWNLFRSGGTLFEDGCQLVFEPGMQNSIGTLIDWFSPQFPSRWTKQRQQLAGLSTNILVILGRRLALWLKAKPGCGMV